MSNGEPNQDQQPASAAFLGARRAESYFEEWPTSVGESERPARRHRDPQGVIAAVPRMGDTQTSASEIADERAGAPDSEQLLQQLSADPASNAVPATQAVVVTQAAETPAAPAPAEQPARSGGWFGLGRRGPSRAQLAAQQLEADRTAIRLASWSRSVGVLVANPKGGVGKTPTALILGGVLANIRGGQTVVFEVTDDAGALAVRAEGPMNAGIAELVRDVGAIHGAGQLSTYTTRQTSYASVVGTPRDRDPLSYEDVEKVSDLLGFFYPIRVMDSGNQASSSAFYGALARTDVLVVPVLEAIDSVAGVGQLFRYLHRRGGEATELARNAIVLRMDDGRPVAPDVRAYVDDTLAAAGVTNVHSIPYDPHIANRSTITLGQLRPATVEAYTHAAAAVTHLLNTHVN